MRSIFGNILTEIAKNDDKVLLIVGDIGYGVFDEFRELHAEKFINIGICEQSMISFSAGLALEGFKPFVYSITPFVLERPFEQIKLDIDQQNVNVNLIGYDDYPKLGPTHKCLNPYKLTKLFVNIKSYFPTNAVAVENNILEAFNNNGPNFIRLTKL